MPEMTPRRQATIVRAIEDHAARYAHPHNPIVNDPARYVADGHVPDATPEEREWIADYITEHPDVLALPPLSLDQLHELNRERAGDADNLGTQAYERYVAGDYQAAREMVDQAALVDPRIGRWQPVLDAITNAEEKRRADSHTA